MIKKILVATDFSENAQAALEHAYELALQLRASLTLLHVQHESSLRTAVREGLVTDSSTDESLRRAVANLIEARFSESMAGTPPNGADVQRVVRRGDADAEIAEFARDTGADLLVVGFEGASAMGRFRSMVPGSVAKSLLRASPCPILVVRPDHRTPASTG